MSLFARFDENPQLFMKSFVALFLFFSASLHAQSITVKDFKSLYKLSISETPRYLKTIQSDWIDGTQPYLQNKMPELTWWTNGSGNKLSIGKAMGSEKDATIFVITDSVYIMRLLMKSIEAANMKSIGDTTAYTDGVYTIVVNVVQDNGVNWFSVSFGKKAFFKS